MCIRDRLQEGLLRWSSQYQAQNNGQAPTHIQLRDQANAMMMPVIINPPGWNNEQSGPAFALDFEGVDASQIRDGELTVGGVKIEPDVVQSFVMAFHSVFGYGPTPQQVVEGLAAAAAGGADLSAPVPLDPGPMIGSPTVPAADPGIGF